jgi:hypothetical protein
MIKLYLVAISFLFFSCLNNSSKTTNLYIIDIPSAIENPKEINLSRFVKSIEYIQLEETDQSMLFYPLIEVTDDFIIARNSGPTAMGPILLFDRKTGKFIRGVGKSGRGPGEFQMGNSTIYNIYSNTLYGLSYSHNDILEFDMDGNFLRKIKLPRMIDEKVDPKIGTPEISLNQYLRNDFFIASIQNFTGWDKRRLIIFSRDSIIKIFQNYLFWKRGNWQFLSSVGINSIFFRWNDQLSFKEQFNDTIFQITENSLIPRFVFKSGGLNPHPELMEQRIDFDELAKYYFIKDISENSDYLFFQLQFNKKTLTAFFDKRYKTTTFCKIDGNNKSAFIDDINGFIPIRPQKITQNNEMIFKLEADDITTWVKTNPEKVKTLGKNLEWVNSISPISNPVIVIAKCK